MSNAATAGEDGLVARRAFIAANTTLLAPPLVPELRLYLAEESLPIWRKTEEELGREGLPPPFWAFAWAGGQALARYILDHPQTVRGKRVVDLAAGSGIDAIAAMKAGAVSALATDLDAFAVAAIAANAAANGVTVSATADDLLVGGGTGPVPVADVLIVGDIFYERSLAEHALRFLDRCRAAGQDVLIGDPGRSYCPRERLVAVAEYAVPVSRELEDSEIKRTMVWRLKD